MTLVYVLCEMKQIHSIFAPNMDIPHLLGKSVHLLDLSSFSKTHLNL